MSLFNEPYFIWEGQSTEVEWAVNLIKSTKDIQLRSWGWGLRSIPA